jgi:sugar phosphate isomerase/epimerase
MMAKENPGHLILKPMMVNNTTRREFLQRTGSIVALPSILRQKPVTNQPPIAFSTIGCPAWNWETIINKAQEWGFAAIELRGINGEMDLTKVPEFAPARIAGTLRELKSRNLKISDLGASSAMHEKDPSVRAAHLDQARRFIDLAQGLEAPYVRVFGDKYVEGEPKEVTIERIIAGLKEVAQHARGTKVGVLFETHGDFTSSEVVAKIVTAVDMPEVVIHWDTRHTCVLGKEAPADTWKTIGKWVRHTHIKDSVQKPKERPVLIGKGDVPVREIVQVLKKGGYNGNYCFEWEKKWYPDIEEPEVALPQYARMIREYFQS